MNATLAWAHHNFTAPFGRIGLSLALSCIAASAPAFDINIGPREVIYTNKLLKSKGLGTWPDGSLGVLRNSQGGYEFYGANGNKPIKTIGTLMDPGLSKS